MRALVWFRSDLRIEDHPALSAAVRDAKGEIAGLFVVTPEQWDRHDWGAPKTDFVLRSVTELGRRLGERGIPLLVRTAPSFDDVPELLERVIRERGVDRVYCHREPEVHERRRDETVRARLEGLGVRLDLREDQCLVPPGGLFTSSGEGYQVFTPFCRGWARRLEAAGPPRLQPPPEPVGPPVESEPVPRWEVAPGIRQLWPAGEGEVQRRLRAFLEERVGRYDQDRDRAAEETTSGLSPYLAAGVLSPRHLLAAALEANRGEVDTGDPGLVAWIRQLAWRDFYRHVLHFFPRVSKGRPFRQETAGIRWRDDPAGLAAWQEGRTGFPIVDAGMRQLAETGWMHNRLRMITASFLAKDLLVDWRKGEAHFARSLVDLDLANNNGGWQWAASTGTDAAPYFRIFNPWTQGKRFDADGTFVHRWVPEVRGVGPKELHEPDRASRLASDYPPPLVDHAKARVRALAVYGEVLKRGR